MFDYGSLHLSPSGAAWYLSNDNWVRHQSSHRFFFKYLEASIYKLMLSAKRPLYYFSIPKLTPLISFLGLSALAASSSMVLSWNSSGHHCLRNPGGKIFSSSVSLV